MNTRPISKCDGVRQFFGTTTLWTALFLTCAIAVGQESGRPPNVANGHEQIQFKPIGRPLAICDADGKQIRTLYLFEGNAPTDVRDPARVAYYHGLDLALVTRPNPLPGFPDWVQDITHRDNITVLQVRFRLSSPQLRKACEAKLRTELREFLEGETRRLKVDVLKVEVLQVPAMELFIAIQDSATTLTLATDKRHIANLGEEVAMSFKLDASGLAFFLRCYKEENLQFKPYYTVRADQIVSGRKRSNVDYHVGLKVKQFLDHDQKLRLKEAKSQKEYLLQDTKNRLERDVSLDIQSDITAPPEVIAFLHSDALLVSSCFDPANNLTFTDFRAAFPDFTEKMLAQYLEPYGVTKYQGKTNETVQGNQRSTEKTSQSGGGFSFSLAIGPLAIGGGGQKDSAKRVLDTIYNATGVRLVEGSTENYYVPAEIKVFRLAEGYENRKITQASSVNLVKGVLNSYLEESPFAQSYDAKAVDMSIANTIGKCNLLHSLLAKRNQLVQNRLAEQQKLDRFHGAIKKNTGAYGVTQKEVCDAYLALREAQNQYSFRAGMSHGYNSIIGPYHGIQHEMDREEADAGRARVIERFVNPDNARLNSENAVHLQKIQALEKAIADHSSKLNRTIAQSKETSNLIDKCQAEIVRIELDIERMTKEIISVLSD